MSKRNYKSKVDGYTPEALDGDGDGLVQDGTEFERPLGAEFDWALEEIFEEPVPVVSAHVVQEGENIQSIASLYCGDRKRQEYAQELSKKNGTIYVGKTVIL
jgi:hypothetical protein